MADGLGEDDEESMDWWTKYFASVDLMIKVGELRDKKSFPNQEGVANRAESLMEQPLLGTDVTARRKSGQVTNIADCCIKIFFKC